MADEVIQACQLEIEGVKMVVKGGVEVAAFVGRILKALYGKAHDKASESWVNRGGERSMRDINKLSTNGGQVLKIKKEIADDVIKEAKDRKMHFFKITEPDENDGYVSIYIPDKEAGVYGEITQRHLAKELEKNKNEDVSYNKAVSELKEKLHGLKEDDPERKSIETQIENYEQAIEENKGVIDKIEGDLAKSPDQMSMSLIDYLREFKGTDVEKSPEKAFAELEKGVPIGPNVPAKVLFQPIRDQSLMPDSKVMFYVPEIGAIVTRDFKVDEKTNLVYSDYTFKKDNGEEVFFSDKGITKDEWNEKQLPILLDQAHILEGTLCRTFNDEEKLNRFLAYHNKIENPAKEKIMKKLESGEQVFSSAETKEAIVEAVSEHNKGLASAELNNETLVLTASPDMFVSRDGKLEFSLSDDEKILFSSVGVTGELAGAGMFNVEITKESKPEFLKIVGDAKTTIPIDLKMAEERIKAATKEKLGKMVEQTVEKTAETISHVHSSKR